MKVRTRFVREGRVRFIVPALLAVVLVLPGAATSSIAQGRSAGSPDTYVTDWDAVGTQAFTCGGPDSGRGPRDLRVRGDRRVRLGDGDRGRLPALRDRRRCARGRLT